MPYKTKEAKRRAQKKWYATHKAEQVNRVKKRQAIIKEAIRKFKEKRGCMDCGIKYPYYVLDFDHREGVDKKFNLSKAWKVTSWGKIKQEIKKCDVVCANCHRVRTHKRINPEEENV